MGWEDNYLVSIRYWSWKTPYLYTAFWRMHMICCVSEDKHVEIRIVFAISTHLLTSARQTPLRCNSEKLPSVTMAMTSYHNSFNSWTNRHLYFGGDALNEFDGLSKSTVKFDILCHSSLKIPEIWSIVWNEYALHRKPLVLFYQIVMLTAKFLTDNYTICMTYHKIIHYYGVEMGCAELLADRAWGYLSLRIVMWGGEVRGRRM